MQQQNLCDDYAKEIQGCRDFFSKVNTRGLSFEVDEETGDLLNCVVAENNREKAEGHYDTLLNACIYKYKITPDWNTLAKDPTAAREEIERRLNICKDRIAVNKIVIGGGGSSSSYGGASFGTEITNLFDKGRQILPEEIQPVFRQLRIYDLVLSMLIENKIVNVPLLELPCRMEAIKREGYQLIPIHLSVCGTSRQMQNFFNSLAFCENLYFNVKSFGIEFTGMATPTMIFEPYFYARYDAKNKMSNDNGKGGPMRSASSMSLLRSLRSVGPTLIGGAGVATGFRDNGSYSGGNLNYSVRNSGGRSEYGDNGWVPEEIKRQDFLVYRQERIYRMDINADIIEFLQEDEEDEE